jgi:hypothetical protein
MGAWGPAIFSDDTACDVRDAYKQAVTDGQDGRAATDRLLEQWLRGLPDDDEDAVVFWLALAATQSNLGRLADRVRDKALAVIESGADRERWREVGNEAARQKHLNKLKAQLLGPRPAAFFLVHRGSLSAAALQFRPGGLRPRSPFRSPVG